MKKYLLLLLFSTTVFSSVKVTESDLVSMSQSNPEVESLRQRLQAAEELKGVLTRSFLPKVELSYGRERYSVGPYNHVNQPFGGIEAKINLFNSGKDSLANDKRNLEVNIASIDSKMIKAQVVSQLRKALAQWAYFEEISKTLEDALETNRKNSASAQQRISAGLATSTDTLDFKQQAIMLNQELATLNFEKGVVKRLVLTLMGVDVAQELEIVFENTHPDEGEGKSLQANDKKSLLVKKALLEADIAKIEVETSERWWTPTVDVYGYALRMLQKDREYQFPGQRNDAAIGFRITLPIFDGGEGIKVAKAKESISKAQVSLSKAKELEVQKNILDAVKKLELTHDLIHGAEENVDVMTKYRTGVTSEYGRGVKNSPDMLQASLRWITAKNNFAEIKRNYQFAKADAIYLQEMFE